MFKLRARDVSGGDWQPGHRSEAVVRVAVDAPPRAIWDVLIEPGAVTSEEIDVVSAFVAPGTGPGVGEVQIVVLGRAGTAQVNVSSIVIQESRPPHFVRFHGFTEGSLSTTTSEIKLTQRDRETQIDYRVTSQSVGWAPLRNATVPSERFLREFMLCELEAVARVLNARLVNMPR